MVEILLVLQIFLTEDSSVVDPLCGASSRCEACLLFSNDILRLRLQSVQYELWSYAEDHTEATGFTKVFPLESVYSPAVMTSAV